MKQNIQLAALCMLAALSGILLSAGCKREDAATADADTSPSPSYAQRNTNQTASPATGAGQVDNTRINVRDQNDATLTAGDQGATEADRDITQQIRKSLTGDDKLSTTAKNIKIITRDRKVTLRGPVASEAEKTTITTLAKNVAGEGNVTDELEVKTNP
jgi:hyperosmotically inducible periplasmic protein